MGLNKVTYVDGSTVITAANLNDIQDAVIDLEATRNVPTNIRTAIYTLLENAAYATTGLEDEIAIVEAWAAEITSLTLSASTLSLNQDIPQTLTATTVPSGITVAWTSSDSSVATVSDGVVTGVSNGSCAITASAGDLSATCEVTVSGFVEVVSISAVYTQSGTVLDTDSLDSLKADLVVTATYDDSTTATIPSTDYTLSGTLEVGTSTITVAYGGKTDTFNVTVLRLLYANSTFHKKLTTGTITGVDGGFDMVSTGSASWNLYTFPNSNLPTYGELNGHTLRLVWSIDGTNFSSGDSCNIAFDGHAEADGDGRYKYFDLVSTAYPNSDDSGTYEFVLNDSSWTGGSTSMQSSYYVRYRVFLHGHNGASAQVRLKMYDLGILS